MIYSLEGELTAIKDQFVVIKTAGVGYKVFLPAQAIKNMPDLGSAIKLFTHYYVREDGASLFGFLNEEELKFFELLINISGIGPKSALGILGVASIDKLKAAIKEGNAEILTKVSGVGRKTAERVILELRNKVDVLDSDGVVKNMETDSDLEDALVGLGYQKGQIREVLRKINPEVTGLESRLKLALQLLKNK